MGEIEGEWKPGYSGYLFVKDSTKGRDDVPGNPFLP